MMLRRKDMAKIIENRVTIIMSRLAANAAEEPEPVLDADQLDTLQKAVEGLVDDSSIVVEIEA